MLFKLSLLYDKKPYFESLSLEVLSSYNAIINLTPNADYANKLKLFEDSYDIYRLHIPPDLFAIVKLMPCFGAVRL